jgi:nitroreductase/NAD-dependent dihydropyrimidine dehydrogenase PreA subunit
MKDYILPEIDKNRCVGCGACIEVCPDQTISLQDEYAEISGKKCMACGHCVAVCPETAISLDIIDESLGFQSFKEELQWMNFEDGDTAQLVRLMRSRRSCRNYSTKPVLKEILEDLVKIGTTAPSGTNSQPWTFLCLTERDQVKEFGAQVADFYRRLNQKAANPLLRFLSRIFLHDTLGRYYKKYYHSIKRGLDEWEDQGVDRLFHGATAVILVGGKTTASCPAEDGLLATQNILLAAHTMGLGTCLIGFAVEALKHDRKLREYIQLPKDEAIYAVIGLGYPAEQYQKVAGRKRIIPRYMV